MIIEFTNIVKNISVFQGGRSELILLHCFFAWLCAQGMKVLLCYWNHSFKLERCVGTGEMPFSHSSAVACLAASVAMQDGLSSSTFAIAFIFAFIVIYDALNLLENYIGLRN